MCFFFFGFFLNRGSEEDKLLWAPPAGHPTSRKEKSPSVFKGWLARRWPVRVPGLNRIINILTISSESGVEAAEGISKGMFSPVGPQLESRGSASVFAEVYWLFLFVCLIKGYCFYDNNYICSFHPSFHKKFEVLPQLQIQQLLRSTRHFSFILIKTCERHLFGFQKPVIQ